MHSALPRAAAALLAACATIHPATLAAQSVRDSAGARVVTNTRPTWSAAQRLRLSSRPTLVIGDRAGDPYEFTAISGAFFLSDGRILVADGGSNELRMFSANGTHVQSFGRRGDGPGEFRRLHSVQRLAGDTIAVLHEMSSLSRFTSGGTYLSRTNELTSGMIKPGAVIKSVQLALNGSARLVISMPWDPPTQGAGVEFDARALHEVVSGTAAATRSLGELPVMRASANADGASKPWLGAEAVYASDGSRFCRGYGTSYTLTCYTAAGVTTLIIRRAWQPPNVSRQQFVQFTDAWLSRWSKATGAARDDARREQLDMPYFKTLPAFSALLLDRVGRLWARTPASIDAAVAGSLNDYAIGASLWSVFDARGVWLGDVTMPARFSPLDVGADYVLGVMRDDDGVQTVVRYSLGAV